MAEVFKYEFNTRSGLTLLGRLSKKLQGTTALNQAMAGIVAEEISSAWREQRSPNGESWAELRPTTLAEKESLGYGNRPILERTKQGKSSTRISVGRNSVDVLTEGYMTFHQQGAPRRGLPKRAFIPTAQELQKSRGTDIRQTALGYLNPSLGQFASGEVARSRRILSALIR